MTYLSFYPIKKQGFTISSLVLCCLLAGDARVELALTVLETAVLPLNYTPRWWRETDSNRRTLWEQIYSLPRLASSLSLQDLVPTTGIEPVTY